jgi:hypothetical protein
MAHHTSARGHHERHDPRGRLLLHDGQRPAGRSVQAAHAFSAVPVGPEYTQLQLFPESPERLTRLAGRTGFALTGPQRAFLIQGDDQLEAIADIHAKLFDAQINVYASNGVTDGRGGYGYILYVRPEHFDAAARVLRL